MSIIRNTVAAAGVASLLALGIAPASAGGAAHDGMTRSQSIKQSQVKRDRQARLQADNGWNENRDPVTGIVRGTGEFVGGVVAGTGALVSSAVSGTPGGAYYYSDGYGNDVRFGVGANATAGFSGCATNDGYNRYRDCAAGGTGG